MLKRLAENCQHCYEEYLQERNSPDPDGPVIWIAPPTAARAGCAGRASNGKSAKACFLKDVSAPVAVSIFVMAMLVYSVRCCFLQTSQKSFLSLFIIFISEPVVAFSTASWYGKRYHYHIKKVMISGNLSWFQRRGDSRSLGSGKSYETISINRAIFRGHAASTAGATKCQASYPQAFPPQ